MRLDKYLKVSRILKRRSVSKELADSKRVYVNGKIAKPSTEIKVGDEIRILFGNREMSVRVCKIEKQVNKTVAAELFEIIEEKRIEQPIEL